MKKLLTLCLLAVTMCVVAQQKKVAVYVTGDDSGVNKVLGSKLVSAFARSEEFSAIERTESFLAELSKEQNYQQSGAVDDSELSRLGKQFGVQYICVASVSDAFNEKYLSAHLINVETAQVECTASSSGAVQTLDGIINAANMVSSDLLSSLGRERFSNTKKVAVYVVKNDASKGIGRVLGDKLVAGFTNSGRYLAIERTNGFLTQLKKEQGYQQSGAVKDTELSRLGKQFGVQYVCVAEVADVFAEKYISARLIDVETAEVVNMHEVGGALRDMSDCLKMANEIGTNLSKGTFEEQAEAQRLEAIRLEQERLRAIEDAKKAEEARKAEEVRKAEEERQRIINRYWYNVISKAFANNIRHYGYRCSDGYCGIGVYHYSDGDLYLGFFDEGERDGYGMYLFFDSKSQFQGIYVGNWRDGDQQGDGTYYNSNGDLTYCGKWHNGSRKYDKNSFTSSSTWKFQFINYNDGDKYVGETKNGYRHGKGIYIWENGSFWYGTWIDGQRDGYGIYVNAVTQKYSKGTWKGDTKTD